MSNFWGAVQKQIVVSDDLLMCREPFVLDSNREKTVCAIACCLSRIYIGRQNKRNRFLIESCLKTKNRGRLKAENRFSDDLLLFL